MIQMPKQVQGVEPADPQYFCKAKDFRGDIAINLVTGKKEYRHHKTDGFYTSPMPFPRCEMINDGRCSGFKPGQPQVRGEGEKLESD